METRDLLTHKRGDILTIAVKYGARNVRVFGSVARGDARPDSDVDFLIDMGERCSAFFPGGFAADLEDLLGRKVDIVTRDGLHWYIRDRILQEVRLL